MVVNVSKLKGKMVEKGLTGAIISEKLNIDQSTFYRKLKENGVTFTLDQVFLIVEVLELSTKEAVEIFFTQELA